MIQEGCQVNARDKQGRTPLHYAAATAQYQSVVSLVANGASLTVTDSLNRTPLHYAAAADSDAKLVGRMVLTVQVKSYSVHDLHDLHDLRDLHDLDVHDTQYNVVYSVISYGH